MQQSLEKLRKQSDSQLELIHRIVRVNGVYAEKVMSSNFAMLQEMLQRASAQNNQSDDRSWFLLNAPGSIIAGYCKTCFRDGLDYQQQVLAELSRK